MAPDALASRSFDSFIGVDLGGGKGKNTAVAILRRDEEGVRVSFVGTKDPEGRPFYDDALASFIRRHGNGALLAVDAPLTLPVCLRCRLPRCPGAAQCVDPAVIWFREKGRELVRARDRRVNGKPAVTSYTQRATEVLLHREYGIQPRETLGQGMGPLTARAHYLRRALEGDFRLNENLIEVYPKATLQVLFGAKLATRYKRRVDTWGARAEILEGLADRLRFEVWREGCLSNDHCFDAVICAFTGYLWCVEGWTLPQADRAIYQQDGWIWFPPMQT